MQLDEIWQTPFASYMREVALTPINSWNEFEDRISCLRELHAELKMASTLLFRGQANQCWHVESTLERRIARLRKCQEDLDYQHYLATINSLKHRVEEDAGFEFDLTTSPSLQSHQPDFGRHYEYLVYLRHHNFPSPMVDWSRSFHVAAHFAFEDPTPYSPNVKIFIFCESPGGVKGGWAADARIIHLNPEGKLNLRHVAQEAEYTICLHPMGGDCFVIEPHTPILESAAPTKHQDLLTSILIPRLLRADFMHNLNEVKLDTHNVPDEHDKFLKSLAKSCFDYR